MVCAMSWSLAWLDESFTRVWDLGAKISSRDKHFAMAWSCWEVENRKVTIVVVLILAFVFPVPPFPVASSDSPIPITYYPRLQKAQKAHRSARIFQITTSDAYSMESDLLE